MKILLTFALAALLQIPVEVLAHDCIEKLPGSREASFSDASTAKITEIVISRGGRLAYVVTSYYGWANLAASVYLRKGQAYCLAGDLGLAVDFKPNKSNERQGLYGLDMFVNQGQDTEVKQFVYSSQGYVLKSCRLIVGKRSKKCDA